MHLPLRVGLALLLIALPGCDTLTTACTSEARAGVSRGGGAWGVAWIMMRLPPENSRDRAGPRGTARWAGNLSYRRARARSFHFGGE